MGILVQNMSYTLTAPLYLGLHLVTSPLAFVSPPSSTDTAAAHEIEGGWAGAALLPLANAACFWVPAVMMYLPSPAVVAPAAHYAWDAIWQPFPVTQNALHWLLGRVVPPATTKRHSRRRHTSAAPVYVYVMALCAASQLPLLAVALTPPDLVPAALADWRPLFADVSFASAFVPYWPSASPVVDASGDLIKTDGRAELVRLFFQWDVYCGGAALLIWAFYLLGIAGARRSSINSRRNGAVGVLVVLEALLWTLLGGPTAAAAVLLWKRDAELDAQRTAATKAAKKR